MDRDTFVRQCRNANPAACICLLPETYCMEQAPRDHTAETGPRYRSLLIINRRGRMRQAICFPLGPCPYGWRLVVVKDAPWFLPSRRTRGAEVSPKRKPAKPAEKTFSGAADDMLHPGLCLIFTSHAASPSPWVSWVKQKGWSERNVDAVASSHGSAVWQGWRRPPSRGCRSLPGGIHRAAAEDRRGNA